MRNAFYESINRATNFMILLCKLKFAKVSHVTFVLQTIIAINKIKEEIFWDMINQNHGSNMTTK